MVDYLRMDQVNQGAQSGWWDESATESSLRVCVLTSSSASCAHASTLGPAPRAELLHVLMLPDFERADRIGEFWGYPESRAFAELLIDCEEDRTLRSGLPRIRPRASAARNCGVVDATRFLSKAPRIVHSRTSRNEIGWSTRESAHQHRRGSEGRRDSLPQGPSLST